MKPDPLHFLRVAGFFFPGGKVYASTPETQPDGPKQAKKTKAMTKQQYLESVASVCSTLKAAGIPLKWVDYLPAVELFDELRARGEKVVYCCAVCSERFGIPADSMKVLIYKMRAQMPK